MLFRSVRCVAGPGGPVVSKAGGIEKEKNKHNIHRMSAQSRAVLCHSALPMRMKGDQRQEDHVEETVLLQTTVPVRVGTFLSPYGKGVISGVHAGVSWTSLGKPGL